MVISTSVQMYSLEYLRNDPHICRFFSLLSLFTFAMLLLIAGDNLLIVFFGRRNLAKVKKPLKMLEFSKDELIN